MQSLRDLFRYGMGPSSSHTMGPRLAAERFRESHPDAHKVRVTLYGSLSLTGKGHLTDKAVEAGLSPLHCEIAWCNAPLPFHPNGMKFEAVNEAGICLDEWTVYSVGGGELREATQEHGNIPSVYAQHTMTMILNWAHDNGKPLWALVEQSEDADIWNFFGFVWEKMQEAIREGLAAEGALPGGLRLQRKASSTLIKSKRLLKGNQRTGLIAAYALAGSENNAGGGFVVTAPTCGSCGVLPAVLFYLQHEEKTPEQCLLKALATAGLVGNVAKNNASISGADVGCQGEVGVACAMAAAAAAQLLGGTPGQIEYAAEMGLEHHLGLTCDPILGLVQVPCIERNVFAAIRALACAEYALLSDGLHIVSFDQCVETMKQTGHDLPSLYRETALGGLAKLFRPNPGLAD